MLVMTCSPRCGKKRGTAELVFLLQQIEMVLSQLRVCWPV